jgi:hypothetical protein
MCCLARKHEEKLIFSINFYHKKHFHRSTCFIATKTRGGGATETEHILRLRHAADKFFNFFTHVFRLSAVILVGKCLKTNLRSGHTTEESKKFMRSEQSRENSNKGMDDLGHEMERHQQQ